MRWARLKILLGRAGRKSQNQVFFCRFFRELVIAELNHQVAELSLSEAGLA